MSSKSTCGHDTPKLTTDDGHTFCSVECASRHFGDHVTVQLVGFSITQPTGRIEKTVSWWFGGFGAAHQYITAKAVSNLIPRDDFAQAKRLIAGVIWNDFPKRSCL